MERNQNDVGAASSRTRTMNYQTQGHPLQRPYNPYMGMQNPAFMPNYSSPYMSTYMNTPMRMTSPVYHNRYPTNSPNNSSPSQDINEQVDTPLSVSDLQTGAPSEGNMGATSSSPEEGEAKQRASYTSPAFNPNYRPVSFMGQQPPFYNPYLHQPAQGNFTGAGLPNNSSPLKPEDQSRQIAILLAELDTEKTRNKKLIERLAEAEIELESNKISLKTKDVEKCDDTEAKKAADLIQEVHEAQKKRDEAVMSRIKLANKERDEAVHRIQELERRLEDQGYGTPDRSDTDEFEEEDTDEAFDQVLLKMGQTDVSGNMDRECSTLVKKMEKIKQRQQEIHSEEVQAILDQRDAALAKACKLEEELLRTQRYNSAHSEQMLRAKIQVLQHERDIALSRIRQLQDEIQKEQIFKSLQKSLSQEAVQRVNNNLDNPDLRLVDMAEGGRKEDNTHVAQLREAEHNRLQMEADLQKMEHALEESEGKVKKLERLVDILRRKLASIEKDQPLAAEQ